MFMSCPQPVAPPALLRCGWLLHEQHWRKCTTLQFVLATRFPVISQHNAPRWCAVSLSTSAPALVVQRHAKADEMLNHEFHPTQKVRSSQDFAHCVLLICT